MPATFPRRTLAAASPPITGIGVRSGRDASVRLLPADDGLFIHRTDIGARVPLHLDYALGIPSCTAIGTGPQDATLFVEHLMAALHALGITDLTIELDGPEIPLLDGSALPWVSATGDAGLADLPGQVEPLVVTEPIELRDGDKSIAAEAAAVLSLTYALSYANPLIGAEAATFTPGENAFATHLAPARTFALIEEIEQARAAGVLRGGSEGNCRIVYADHMSDEPTLPDEFARHKLLDMMGDLYLLGRPVIGAIRADRTGHAYNRELLRRLAACDTL
jgi:UDP-3-O-[3-hydroxymyristoyl] N-acetylglucosamine deacetylase